MHIAYEIRDALPTEAAILTEISIRSKAHWGYDQAFMDACLDELNITAREIEIDIVRVLKVDGTVVGYYHSSKIDVRGFYELEAIFIEPANIGKGYGKLLWVDLENTLVSRDARNLVVQSDPNAAEFYKSMGMKLFGERESGSIPGRYLPLLEKTIENIH